MSSLPSPARVLRGTWLIVRIAIARLRFLFILGVIFLAIVKWNELVDRYERHVRPAAAESVADPDHEFYCPMHPTVVRDTNKEKCPICFMPLSKRKKGEATDDPLPAGTVSRVQLSPYRVVLAGVRTVPVTYQSLTKDLPTAGTVEFDERKLRTVPARVKGRIDKLLVNQTGQMVRKDDPLAELYSPDLVVTVQNLLDARAANNSALEKIARERLVLWGIDAAQIDAIIKNQKPITHLTIRSPITGHVLRKAVREGQYVEEGGTLFDVADLSTVWVQAQLYEDDLAFLPSGGHDPKTGKPDFTLPITATTRAFPGKVYDGALSFLFPHVDAETRTLTVRFELPNQDHELRPGMSATVTLHLDLESLAATPAGAKLQLKQGRMLAVHEAAVIDTGAQKVVYRESLPNTFEGVLVKLGPRMRDADGVTFYPVISGLNEEDRIVTAGSFLIDAETRLNPAAGSIYIGGSGTGKGGATTVRPTTPDDEAEKVAAAIAKLSPADRKLAQSQRFCPIRHEPLGTMGVPVRITLEGQPIFVCCKACIAEARADPKKTIEQVEAYKRKAPPPQASTPPVVPLTAEDLADIRDGIMGQPLKVDLGKGRTVWVCCKGCPDRARKDADGTLKKIEEFKKLPPIETRGKP